MTRKLNLWLALILVAIFAPIWWFLMDNRPGDAQPLPIHMAQLRTLAAAMPGPAPTGVEVEVVATRSAPAALFAAGLGIQRRVLAIAAYRLPVPGRGAVIIDAGLSRAAAHDLGFSHYNDASAARIRDALARAGLILFTHEHADHIGQFVDAMGTPQGRKLFTAARIPPAQLPPTMPSAALPWPRDLPHDGPGIDRGGPAPHAVAPGIVVIPAPSHTPGSQMIYARLADGREFLFTGDVATLSASWEQLRARSRLMGQWIGKTDRRAVYSWLMTVRQLHAESPTMVVVPGHDNFTLQRLAGEKVLGTQFTAN